MPRIIMFIDPVITAAGITAGASLAAGAGSIFGGANMNKKNRKWQEKMVKEQREHEQKLYDERYSPAAQAQNLRSAGINPTGNTQTMNVGSSTSTPTPATQPLDFSFISRAGESVANSLQAYRAMKLEQDKLTHQANIDWKKSIQDDIRLAQSREEIEIIRKRVDEEIRDSEITRKDKELRFKLLEEAVAEGYNNYKNEQQQSDDDHQAHLSQMAIDETIRAYNEARTASEKRNEAYIVAQTAMTYLKNELLRIEKIESTKESKRNDKRFQWETTLQHHKERTMKLLREAQATENEMNEVKLEYAKMENDLYKNGLNSENWRLALDKGISHISGAVAYVLGGKANNSGPIPIDTYAGWNTNSTY